MTPAEWEFVEAQLSSPFSSPVDLLCDGHELTLDVVKTKPLQYAIHIYVGGVFKGAWCNSKLPCEEQRRFMRCMKSAYYSPSKLAKLAKLFSKKELAQMKEKHFTFFTSMWPTFAPLKRHLVANNKSIELVPGGHNFRAVAKQAARRLDAIAEALA